MRLKAEFLGESADQLHNVALFLLRVVAGFDFSLHGFQKVFGWFADAAGHAARASGLPLVGGYIEVVAGILVILGLFTRPIALIACSEMAVAYFKVHAPRGFWPIMNHGELAMLFCFIFLFFAAVGAGSWSLDAILLRRSTGFPGKKQVLPWPEASSSVRKGPAQGSKTSNSKSRTN